MMLIVVVDDINFASNDRQLMKTFKKNLKENFRVKLLRNEKYFIRWEIQKLPSGITTEKQKTYVKKILKIQNLSDLRGDKTPLVLKEDSTLRKGHEANISKEAHERFRSII